jgi:hypothetical protein
MTILYKKDIQGTNKMIAIVKGNNSVQQHDINLSNRNLG